MNEYLIHDLTANIVTAAIVLVVVASIYLLIRYKKQKYYRKEIVE